MQKTISTLLILGIILRLFLSFNTYHSDIVPFDFAGKIIKNGNITNFYDYLWDLPEDNPYLKVYPRNLFNYPPLPYFFLGGASLLTTWMVDQTVHDNFVLNFSSTLGNTQLNLLLLLLKLPYFFFDIGIAYLLMGFFKNETQKKWVFALWMFNPVNLYATYMVGQFDIIPTFLSVLALYFAIKKNNLLPSAILLGLGAAFKIFPLLFIVPLVLIKSDWWGRIKILVTASLTYLVFAFPFIMSTGFRKTAMLAGQTTKSFYAQIPISGGESVILFLAVIIFFYILFMYKKTLVEDLWKRFFVMILIFFIFTHFHPQWFLWTMPFFVIELVSSKLKHWPLFVMLLITFIGMITFFDTGLSIGLFSAINPALYNLPPVWNLLGLNLDINVSRSILQTVFVGISAYYIYEYA
ncbi:MAG: glycosyltransferase family 87 protein [Candidatus Woesebacteria bacterium]|nr:glycosyltransferase family 87 protein [Candidatus Woesebacteria bacterium]